MDKCVELRKTIPLLATPGGKVHFGEPVTIGRGRGGRATPRLEDIRNPIGRAVRICMLRCYNGWNFIRRYTIENRGWEVSLSLTYFTISLQRPFGMHGSQISYLFLFHVKSGLLFNFNNLNDFYIRFAGYPRLGAVNSTMEGAVQNKVKSTSRNFHHSHGAFFKKCVRPCEKVHSQLLQTL